VNVWQVAGPFSQKGVGGLDLFNVPFGPETDSNYSEWTKMPVDVDDFDAGCVNLLKLFNTENSVAYLKTNVWIDSAQKVILEIGSDDGVKVWINHQLVHQNDQERGLEQGQDLAEADFKKGWNLILMKITQGEGEWGASLSISDLHRKLIDGLTYK